MQTQRKRIDRHTVSGPGRKGTNQGRQGSLGARLNQPTAICRRILKSE